MSKHVFLADNKMGQRLTGCEYIHSSKISQNVVPNPELTALSSPQVCPIAIF